MAAACATLAPAALAKNSRTSSLTDQMARVSLSSPLCGSSSSGFIARFVAPSAAPKRSTPAASAVVAMAATAEQTGRLRLTNVSPQEGSRKEKKRWGRGPGSGMGRYCGRGLNGQNCRNGGGVRPGFEGGQMPLYRRLPKKKGIAGGMGAGLPKFITINVGEIGELFAADEEVSLESLQAKRILNLSGRDRELPLKLLGEGDISIPLKVKGAAMSEAAREKLEKAGGSFEQVKLKKKWSRWATEDAA